MSTLAEPRSPPARDEAPGSAARPASYSPLVLTKIRPPQPRPRVVDRGHLFNRLAGESPAGFILLSAPAGYGKTTLLTAWSHARVGAGCAVAWYALDATDDDPSPFGAYLVGSLSQALGTSDGLTSITQLLRSSPEVDLLTVMSAIINAVAASSRECLLVLDDYHQINAPAIHQAVTFLLEHSPENLRVAIGSRSDPPLPIARLRARGKLAEIRAADLRFTREETAAFLNEIMQLALQADVVAALEARTEGWIAGLQLAALSMASRPVDAEFIASFEASNRFLIQYLLEEVVGRQPEQVQDFLLATSILERLCGPLCDAILGHSGSDDILQRLERANLFLVPLDEEGVWYRYHHLFRDFLRGRLQKIQPERVASLHRSASEWYQTHGPLREAVRHALESRDRAFAAEVVERHGMATLMHSEISTVYEWCRAFPDEVLESHPMLCVLLGWTLVLGYRRDHQARVDECLRMAERAAAELPDQEHGRWLLGQAAVVRAFQGNAPDPHADSHSQLALAQRALDLLPPGDPLRSTTMLTIGYAHLALQDAQAACQVFERARVLSLEGQNYYGAVEARFQQARLAHQRGQLGQAAAICGQGRAEIAAVISRPTQELPAVGSLDIALGCVLLEQDELAEAERTLTTGLDLVGWTINPYYQLTARVALARLREIQGREAEAGEIVHRLDELWPDIGFCTEGLRILHSLRGDKPDAATLASATAWGRSFRGSLGEDMPLPGIGPLGSAGAYYLALLSWARVQIAIGAPRDALAYLERQLAIAERHDLKQRIVELSLAEALAHSARGDSRRATEALVRALETAEPLGYVRTFDQGPVLTCLLSEACRRGISRGYIQHLLHAIDSTPPSGHIAAPTSASGLVDPLTARELEVLKLLESGLLNRQIADELVISVGTVKRHTANIYAKLGVDTRTQALGRARGLGLL